MSEWRGFVAITKKKNVVDIVLLFVTFALTVIFDLVVAIAVGVAVKVVCVLAAKIFKKNK